jgi:predicted transcriptional regulator
MSRRIASVLPDTSVDELAKLLVSRHLPDAAVVDQNNKLIGTVSETAIISREVCRSTGKKASDIMSPPDAAITEDMKIQELGGILADRRVDRLFVLNKDNQPIGSVSGSDILKAIEEINRE